LWIHHHSISSRAVNSLIFGEFAERTGGSGF
jgi:hypothetical protein